jgi:NAD(P)-dependent dehydrogenase (short-subunit alcohol dehydrogenase family)
MADTRATPTRVALVTGCSSGIGEAIARNLVEAGYRVYATARDPASLRGLDGVVPLALDLTDEESVKQAVAVVFAGHGHLDVLVNNAGVMVAGAAEDASLDQVRDQFEVNFFGLVRLTQLVLPRMRERGTGTIVNLSSIFGRLSVPGLAHYAASKHAVEAYSEALRLEVAPFGVRVVMVEPGPVHTRFGDSSIAALSEAPGGPGYERFNTDLIAWFLGMYEGPKKNAEGAQRPRKNLAGWFALRPEAVAKTVTRAAGARRPPARYRVGILARMLLMLRRQAPQPAFEAFVRFQFPHPRRSGDARERAADRS